MKTKKDIRSNRFVFVPFCTICQAFQAQGIVCYNWSGIIREIMEVLIRHDVNVIQMPCAEAGFCGLKREPKSLKQYDTPEFREFCRGLARGVFEQMQIILKNNYEIVCILGIEFSPSCSTKLQYDNKGTYFQKGVFMDELAKLIKENSLDIPFLGINRRGIGASVKRLDKILAEK